MSNATEDLKSLYISNLNTIRELNSRIEVLETQRKNQDVSYESKLKELDKRLEQSESEKKDQFLQWATGIITVMDTFEKLKKAASKKAINNTSKGKKVLDRYKKARKSLKQLLMQFEISKIKFADNQLIDELFIVVGTEPDANKPDHTILSIVKNGYIHGSELIRKAEVITVKNEVNPGI